MLFINVKRLNGRIELDSSHQSYLVVRICSKSLQRKREINRTKGGIGIWFRDRNDPIRVPRGKNLLSNQNII